MASLQDTKRRIGSITTTKKITKAMELVASAKFGKLKRVHDDIVKYQSSVQKIISDLIKNSENLASLNRKEGKTLWLIVSSSIGLCGGYNSQMNKMIETQIKDSDLFYTIGEKGKSYYSSKGYKILEHYTSLSRPLSYQEVKIVGDKLMATFNDKSLNISTVKIVYTKFINAATFEPMVETLFPLEKNINDQRNNKEIIFEPNINEAIIATIPLYFNATIYGLLSHSFISEEGSRRVAMEAATENAEEIQGELELEYNRKRQAAITQEIAEIVGGANAI